MEPVLSAATKKMVGPPELEHPLSEKLTSLSPPYSIPYAEIDHTSEKLPAAKISEWKPSKEEIQKMIEGFSVYTIIYEAEHPNMRNWVGPPNFQAV